jgi:hypothetical protein
VAHRASPRRSCGTALAEAAWGPSFHAW